MVFPRHKLLLTAFALEGLVLVIALVLAGLLDIDVTLLSENLLADIVFGTALAVPPFGLYLLLLSRRASQVPLVGPLRGVVVNEIRALFADARLIDLVFISMLAGVAEEIMFRGVLQEKLGIIVSSVIFGLVHFVSPAYMVVAVIMSVYLGLVYEMSQSLLIPVQLHFVYDLAALVYLRFFIRVSSNG